MARTHEVRDFLFEFRDYWAKKYKETIDLSPLDVLYNSFESRARENFDRMCDDCKFTVSNGTSIHNPYRESRRKRQADGYALQGIKVGYPKLLDPGPDHLCLECENAWLDELQYGWDLYCEKRLDCISLGVPKDKPLGYIKCGRLPGGKYMWYSYAIPGYTAKEAYAKKNKLDDLFILNMDKDKAIVKEVEIKYLKKWPVDYMRKELLWHKIRFYIAEHIAEDGLRLEQWEAGSKERSNQVRVEIEAEFISKTVDKYGENVLNSISPSDIARYCMGVEAGENEENLWYSILEKYDFDQTTDSCLYFIKQGNATKIGITNSLASRLAQIKTSAAFPCEIMNVVYTHFGYRMEQELHRRLSQYNSHLEWFVLPQEIEEVLFKAKSLNDIEDLLKSFEGKN